MTVQNLIDTLDLESLVKENTDLTRSEIVFHLPTIASDG